MGRARYTFSEELLVELLSTGYEAPPVRVIDGIPAGSKLISARIERAGGGPGQRYLDSPGLLLIEVEHESFENVEGELARKVIVVQRIEPKE